LINSLELYRGEGVRLLGSKSKSFEACKEALSLFNKGLVKSLQGKKDFILNFYNMYEEGSKRKINLKEYLNSFSSSDKSTKSN